MLCHLERNEAGENCLVNRGQKTLRELLDNVLAQAIRKPVSSGKNIGLGQRGKSSRVLYNYFMQSIPETAQPFFQEYEFERLNLERDGDLIIERLLAFGNRDEVRWLLIHYGQIMFDGGFLNPGIRRLPRRRYKLWCVLLT